jgi:hypothetical protein
MRKIKISPGGHLMGEPSLVPPDFFPPKKDEPSDWEAMDEEELLKQWMWHEYNNE